MYIAVYTVHPRTKSNVIWIENVKIKNLSVCFYFPPCSVLKYLNKNDTKDFNMPHYSVLRALSSLRGLRGAPKVPPLCRETQSLGQHMLELSCENAPVGINGLIPAKRILAAE